MKKPADLLPIQFGNNFEVKKITWNDFNGKVNESMPWSAHIYWYIDYEIVDPSKRKIKAQVHIGSGSWVREEKKCSHLLNHEIGHYLIGSLCCLEFLRRLDYNRNSQEKFEDLVLKTFNRTMAEYLDMERKYDCQTEHRLNFKQQEEWDSLIHEKLTYYKRIYDRKKNCFVKYSESSLRSK